MIRAWMWGAVRHRSGRLLLAAIGVAIAVGLLAALGSFVAAAKVTMTARVARDVGIDWQVLVTSGTPHDVTRATRAQSGTRDTLEVGFADTGRLSASGPGGSATTGSGKVLGLPDGYARTFPKELRLLTGTMRPGTVLLAQQTAANLHARPGSTVQIHRSGSSPVTVKVGGIVELPDADVLFHTIGAPPTAQPTAPPDNVVILPLRTFHTAFDPLAAKRPDQVHWQVHAVRDAPLATDPATAYTQSTARAHHLEATLAGAGIVGDDLGDALAAAREDAAYAQVLFLFLGVPGVAVAVLLTVAVGASGSDRRRREQALLRVRGARPSDLIALAAAESVMTGVVGVVFGLGAAALLGRVAFGSAAYGASTAQAILWAGVAALAGLVSALLAGVLPGLRAARAGTVAQTRATVGRRPRVRISLVVTAAVLVVVGALVVRLSGANNYQLVLAPEGAPSISVSYWAFAGPALLWLGGALAVWAVTQAVLLRARGAVAAAARPLTGPLADTSAAVLARQANTMARAVVTVCLALAFAVTTAVFTTTYRDQALVDEQLTNGADVTVVQPPSARVGPSYARRIAKVPGVRAVEPMQHRFAYVGADLQDFYGIRPTRLTRATTLQDSYFQGGTARSELGALATHRNGILVSAETVNDYQLHLGDTIRLRLQDARTGRYHAVPFRYLGIAAEFPTAPRDSFLVANADYVAQQTGTDAVGTFLVRTGRANAPTVAARLRDRLGPNAEVTDLNQAHTVIGSTLTSVDVTGLARIELAAALALVSGAAGLVLGLGLVERRRTAAVAAVLGASRRQLRGLVAVESLAVLGLGVVTAAGLSAGIAPILVHVLQSVFDPPPEHPSVPGSYLAVLVGVTLAAAALATVLAAASSRNAPTTLLREDQQ